MVESHYEGIIPPVITPFKPNKELDEEGFRNVLNFLIENGVHGLWIEGSSGEFSSMSIEERKKVLDISIDEAGGEVPILAGVSHSSTKIAVELAEYAEDAGADAVQSTPPYYFQVSDSSLFEHFEKISEAVDIPLVLYDNIGTTHHGSSISLIGRLLNELGMRSIKICPYPNQTPLEKAIALKDNFGDDINPIVAGCQYAYWAFSLGVADGTISGPLNAIPKEFVDMYEAVKEGDDEKAENLQYNKILPVAFSSFNLSGEEHQYTQTAKLILKWKGVIDSATVRQPLSPLSDWQEDFFKSMAENIGIIEE